jgi:heme/copper-type cytochrome/quinol oxidase subunit 3
MSQVETTAPEPVEIVGDISALRDYEFGHRSVVWWGTFGFMLLEGSGFVLAAGAYLYLAAQGATWPPAGDALPAWGAGALFTLVTLASLLPNYWLEAKAKAQDEHAVRMGLVVMTVVGLVLTAIRAWELTQLNVRWDHDAYGSLVWLLMVLHTVHLLTDLGDTAVITLWFFTHKPDGRQFADVKDNAGYWTFVVVSWLPIFALIYGAPRWL